MTPEAYSEFMVRAILHLAEQLNAIRLSSGISRVGSDRLHEELAQLASEAMRLVGGEKRS